MRFNRRTENLVANLRGLPEDTSHSIRRPAKSIGDLVDKVFERYKINQPRIEDIIMANWKQIVGEKAAHRCSPLKIIQKKRLIVFTTNATIRSELNFNRRELIKKISALPNCETIKEITFQ